LVVEKGKSVRVALWATVSLTPDGPALREGEYLYPGRPLGTAALGDLLQAAASADHALGPRFEEEAPASAATSAPSPRTPSTAPVVSPSSLPAPGSSHENPEGKHDPGKPLYGVVDEAATADALLTAGLSAARLGYGRLRIVSGAGAVLPASRVNA